MNLSYYASANGILRVQPEKKEEVLEELRKWYDAETISETEIDVATYANYDEDKIGSIHESIREHVEGELYFNSEDHENWKFVFDGKNVKEKSGRLIYSKEDAIYELEHEYGPEFNECGRDCVFKKNGRCLKEVISAPPKKAESGECEDYRKNEA